MSNTNISGQTAKGGVSVCATANATEGDFYKVLFEYAPDAYYLNDLNGILLDGNRAAETLLGYQRSELIGKNFVEAQILPRDQEPLAMEMLAQNAAGQPAGPAELRLRRKDGVEVHVEVASYPVQFQGRIVVLGNARDITARKQSEAQFLRSQRLESIGHLASGIAHDLNNILMPITMVLPMVREQITNPEVLSLLETVETSAQRGASIVKQVLTFARGVRAEKSMLQPAEMLAELAAIIREAFPRAISVKTAWPKQLWPISGDFTQLHQVLMNLCVNARDAMPEGGTLTLTAENVMVDDLFASAIPEARPGAYVVVLVADTGTGIAPEHLDQIFDPFFTTKEFGKGTGLGLSTALGIVRSHGGFLRVESKPGRGTQFRVYLPALSGECAPAESLPQPMPQGRGELILVVDDEESIRVVVQRILERNGYRVLLASEGAEAVMLFSQQAKSIAAVLTDLMMPQMSGATMIRILQKISPQLKVLVATGLETSPEVNKLASLGVQMVLRKPFAPRTLLQHLRDELDR